MEIQNNQYRQILMALALFSSLKGVPSSVLLDSSVTEGSSVGWVLEDEVNSSLGTDSLKSTAIIFDEEPERNIDNGRAVNNIISHTTAPQVIDAPNLPHPDIAEFNKWIEVAKNLKDITPNLQDLGNHFQQMGENFLTLGEIVCNSLPTKEVVCQKANDATNDAASCIHCVIGITKCLCNAGHHGYQMLCSLCTGAKMACKGAYRGGAWIISTIQVGYCVGCKVYDHCKHGYRHLRHLYRGQVQTDHSYITVAQ